MTTPSLMRSPRAGIWQGGSHRITGLLLVTLVATGCGSTVQQRSVVSDAPLTLSPTQSAGSTSGGYGSTSSGGSTGNLGTAGAAPVSGIGSTGSVAPAPGGATSRRSGATGVGTPTGHLPGHGPGVTDSIVKLGFLYLGNAGSTAAAAGVKGYSQGDEVGEMKALIADQNAAGGLAGRKIVLDAYNVGGSDAASYQAACTRFTQDDPVFMVLSALSHIDQLSACLAKAGVGYTADFIAPSDRQLRGYGPIYAPDDIAMERYALLLGRSLVNGGLLKAGDKVAIVRQDTADYARVTKDILRPILGQAGVKVVDEETYNINDSSGTTGVPSAVFRMRGAGATAVINYESPLLYMTAAESQGWRPFWTVTSRASASFLESGAPADQLANSGGPGWMPVSDIDSSRRTTFVSPEEQRCVTSQAKHGFSYTGAPRLVQEFLCGELFHIVRVVAHATELSPAGFRASAETLPAYPPTLNFKTSFDGGRHDGAAAYRILRYQKACSCFNYTGPITPTPDR